MPNQDKPNDDFFSLLAKEQKNSDPFGGDEILFKDESGNLKILRGGKVLDYKQGAKPAAVLSNDQIMPSQVKTKPRAVTPPVMSQDQAASGSKSVALNQEVDNIVKKAAVNFADAQAERRFRNIIRSRLKDIRDQVQTRESLMSSTVIGGMGFDAKTADRILSLINQELHALDGKFRQVVGTDQFFELQAEAKKILAEPLLAPVAERPAMVYQPDQPSPEAKPVTPVISQVTKPTWQTNPAAPVAISRPIISQESSKPKIEDVKFHPKLTGPIEEIRTLTLKDFRRLASSPKGAMEKIMEKIALLEEESFSKKVQAIKAWKDSEVNRLYLTLGDQSMEERKSIAEVIAERNGQNQPTLTPEELEAIFELNKKLRY